MADITPDSLDSVTLLASLTPEVRRSFAQRCRWRTHAPGEQIIDRQSEARDVFFVARGKVRVVIYSMSGREVTLDDIGPGAYFGELAALDGMPRSASVMAIDETSVAIASPELFLKLLMDSPPAALAVMKRLTTVIRSSIDRIMDLSTVAANNRVQAEILRLAKHHMKDDRMAVLKPVPVHSDIASRVSTTRETVARVFSELSRQGILKRDGNTLLIPDIERLAELVEEVRGE